jgi:NAD(P)H-flavin reductase/hemoglobin-like flavoprotein
MSDLSRALKESWTLVEERQDKLASYFYARFFASNPKLRELFPVHMDPQRARLLRAVVTAIQTIDDPERFGAYIRALGRNHRKYQVSPAQYDLFGTALLDALRTFAGDRWSTEYDQAWREAYDLIRRNMILGAEEDPSALPFWPAEVITHERRGADVAVFTCRPLQPFIYRPGQYAELESPHQPQMWRRYSIANAPRVDNVLEFHVRALSTGLVSSALAHRLRPGDLIRIAAPAGSMTLDNHSTRDVVCVAGGTGLAPIKALIEQLAQHNTARWVHVFFGARNRDDLYDLPRLAELTTRHSWLSVVPACSEDPTWDGERGNIPDVLARQGPRSNHDFFVSGSAAMVKATLGTLAELQVPAVRIKYDALGEI